jgi:hypothetical protein
MPLKQLLKEMKLLRYWYRSAPTPQERRNSDENYDAAWL